jgi:hypothetical protein
MKMFHVEHPLDSRDMDKVNPPLANLKQQIPLISTEQHYYKQSSPKYPVEHQTLSHQLSNRRLRIVSRNRGGPFQDIKPVIPSLIYVPRGTFLSDRGPLRRRTHTTRFPFKLKSPHLRSEILLNPWNPWNNQCSTWNI